MIARSALAVLSLLFVYSCAASDGQPIEFAEVKQNSKVDHALVELHEQFTTYKKTHKDSEHFESTNPQLRIADGRVLIDAIAADSAAALESELRALGAKHLSSYGRVVSGFFPITGIARLADLTSLNFARPAYATTRPK